MAKSGIVSRAWLLCLLLPCLALAAEQAFDLAAYRLRVASDRAAGIAEGRRILDSGQLQSDPSSERMLLWYMGGAAVGIPDDIALGEVVLRLEGLAQGGDIVAAPYADLLRGARLLDQGEVGDGLARVLEAANVLAGHPDRAQRIIASSELCRAYINADRPGQAQAHCREHSRQVREAGDPVALARAEYMEAGVLSRLDLYDQSVPLWRSSRQRFLDAGQGTLAGRAAAGLAGDLVSSGDFEGALEMARESEAAAREAGNPISVHYAQGAAAEALGGLGRHDEALAVVNEAIAGLEALHHPGALAGMLETRIAILEAAGIEPQLLADSRLRLAELRAPEMDEAAHDLVTDLEQRYRQREQALRIRELEHQNRESALALDLQRAEAQRQDAALRNQRLVTTLLVLLAVVLLAALAAGLMLLRSQRRLASTLHDQAFRDVLTTLPNRRALLDRVQELLLDPQATRRGHALLMVDLDHFKAINDRGGHLFGDQVLVGVAHCLQRVAGSGNLVARLGGEEFVVLCPGIGRERARDLAEQLRAAVAAQIFENGGRREPVTISLGVAVFDGKASHDLSSWLGQADAAVYRAKAAGRDLVETA